MSTTTVPEGLQGMDMPLANRRFTLALSEVAECQRDLAGVALMPANEGAVSKLAGVAAGLDRAAGRIREALLSQQPPAAPVVTPEMIQAADDAMVRQFRAADWESAKDAIEGLDLEAVITAALAKPPTLSPTPEKDPSA